MKFTETSLPGCYVVELDTYSDARGWFARTYCKNEFQKIGYKSEWVQLNHSVTYKKGSIRGMHYQKPPYQEIKMVRCIVGAIYDVVIDLRRDSPTFMKWYGTELSAQNKKMMYIPHGCAHGFQTLRDDCELIYHHSEFYMPDAEAAIRYDEPGVNIQWPLIISEISERDNKHPYLGVDFKGI